MEKTYRAMPRPLGLLAKYVLGGKSFSTLSPALILKIIVC